MLLFVAEVVRKLLPLFVGTLWFRHVSRHRYLRSASTPRGAGGRVWFLRRHGLHVRADPFFQGFHPPRLVYPAATVTKCGW